jgi:hypothetical protein
MLLDMYFLLSRPVQSERVELELRAAVLSALLQEGTKPPPHQQRAKESSSSSSSSSWKDWMDGREKAHTKQPQVVDLLAGWLIHTGERGNQH